MPSLLIEDIPAEVYEYFRRRAQANQRTVESEVLNWLQEVSRMPAREPGAFFMTDEVIPPCDIPIPATAVRVPARDAGRRLPDPGSFAEG